MRVVIIGASGFGGEVAWTVRRMAAAAAAGGAAQAPCPCPADGTPVPREALRAPRAIEIAGFCDDAPEKRSGIWRGLPLLGPVETAACGDGVHFHVAVGCNAARERLAARAAARGWLPLTVIDPAAVVAPDARVGDGCYIGAGAVVSCGATLGAGVIVNLQATVGHDAVVDSFAQICPGARVSGGCRIGARALLGSNAVVIPGVCVGADATVGASAAALRDVPGGGGVVRMSRSGAGIGAR